MLAVQAGRQNLKQRLLAAAQQKCGAARSPSGRRAKTPLSFDPRKEVEKNFYAIQGELSRGACAYLVNDLADQCRNEAMESIKADKDGGANSLGFIARFATGFRFVTTPADKYMITKVAAEMSNYWSFTSCRRCLVDNGHEDQTLGEAFYVLRGQLKGDEYRVHVDFSYSHHHYSNNTELIDVIVVIMVECWPANLQRIAHDAPIVFPYHSTQDIQSVAREMVRNYCDGCKQTLGALIEFALQGTTLAAQKLNINSKTLSNVIDTYITQNSQFWLNLSKQWSNALPHHVARQSNLVGGPVEEAPCITNGDFPTHLRHLAAAFAFVDPRDVKLSVNYKLTTGHNIEAGLLIQTPIKKHCLLYKVLLTTPKDKLNELVKSEPITPILTERTDAMDDVTHLWRGCLRSVKRSSGALNHFAARMQGLIEASPQHQHKGSLHFLYYRQQEGAEKIHNKLAALLNQTRLHYLQAILEHEEIPQDVKKELLNMQKQAAQNKSEGKSNFLLPILLQGPKDFMAVVLPRIEISATNIVQKHLHTELVSSLYTDLEFFIWRKNSKGAVRRIYYEAASNRKMLGTYTSEILQNLGVCSCLDEQQIIKNWQRLLRAAKR